MDKGYSGDSSQVWLIPKPWLALSVYRGKDQPAMRETARQELSEWCAQWLNVMGGNDGQGWGSGKTLQTRWALSWVGKFRKDTDGQRGGRRAFQATGQLIFLDPGAAIPSVWMDIGPAKHICGHNTEECWPRLSLRRCSVNQKLLL